MTLEPYLFQEMVQSRHLRWKLLIRYATGQQAEGEDRVGEPGDQVFLRMDETSRYVGSAKRRWRGISSNVVDVALGIIRDVNLLPLLEFCMRLLCVKPVET